MKKPAAISPDSLQELIIKKIGKADKIFIHCFSQTVIKALIEAKKAGKKFTVYNTELRPKYLGRRAAKQLAAAKIPVIQTIDLLAFEQLAECKIALFGAESITTDGLISNKVGTGAISAYAQTLKIPSYCCTSIKKVNKKISRKNTPAQVWKNPAKNITIENPGFETLPLKAFTSLLTEKGEIKTINQLQAASA